MRVAFIAAGLGSALGYYGASVALNAEPPDPASTGWIAVLTPISTLESDVQVRVNAFALDHRTDPRMAYGLSLCGADSFSGYFLIGGGARLLTQDIEASPNTVRSLVPGDIEVDDVGTGQRLKFKDVQVLEVEIGSLPPCVGAVSEQTFVGTGFRVEGIASEPVVTSPSTGVFDSAVQRWSMPYVGSLPGTGNRLGEFRVAGALDGSYVRPRLLAVDVDAGTLSSGMELDQPRPAPLDSDVASWFENAPIQATTKVREPAKLSSLQRWSALFAVGLGVFGSIVASMLLEWTRTSGHRPEAREAATLGPLDEPLRDPEARRTGVWLLAVPLLVLAYLLRRARGGHRP